MPSIEQDPAGASDLRDLADLGAVAPDADFSAWSAVERDALRWTLVGWRDQGRREDAEAALRAAARRWPEDPVFLLELLVLQATDTTIVLDQELSRAPAEALRYPEISLLRAQQALAIGDVEDARRLFDQIGDLPVERLSPFAGGYADVLRRVRLEPARGRYLAAAAQTENPLDTPEGAELVQILSLSLVHADRHGNLFDLVRALMYFETLEIPGNTHMILRAMEVARPRLSVDGRVIHLELIAATYNPEQALPLVKALLDDSRSRVSARFAKAGARVAARLKDGALERRILSRFVASDNPGSGAAAAQAEEIRLRRRALGADRPMEVFVGLFGQMREPEAVLPQAVEAIKAAFGTDTYGPFDLHFALSTWPRTGGRSLSLEDAAGFFTQAAPAEVRPLLTPQNGTSGHALKARLPNLIAALTDHSAAQAAREAPLDELKSYLPRGADIVTTPEAEVEAEVRPGLARIGREHPPTINQFKMWSRVAGLKQPLLAHEAAIGRPVDLILLIRCDLANVRGDLTEFAARAVSPYEHASVFYDYDPHAEFIEGSGDRYMMGARDSVMALLGGYDHYLETVRAEPVGVLSTRLEAHSGVQSIMMLNGLTPAPIWALSYELHRGAPKAASLIQALKADHDAATDADLRTDIQAVLSRVAPVPGSL